MAVVNDLYDKTEKMIDLTSDEIDILINLLSYRLERCVSIGEEITIGNLLDKILS